MINSIQNKTNYRPNFGMAIRINASEAAIQELGKNIKGLRELEELARKAATNTCVDVGLPLSGPQGVVLIDKFNTKIPDSFIPKEDSWLETIKKGVNKAEEIKKLNENYLPDVEEGAANEEERLKANIRTLSGKGGDYPDYFSQMYWHF